MQQPTEDRRGIHWKERLNFADNAELRAYYEEKYGKGGYDEGGAVVHGVDVSALYHARRKEAALRLLDLQPGEVALDAGCGRGELAAQMAARCREVLAIDIAANAFDPQYRALPNLRFQAMEAEKLAFPDQSFDKVVTVEMLEHLIAPERALAELHRVLKRNGRCIMTYPTINRTLVKHLRLGRPVPISEHLNEWSYRELVAAVESAGFFVETVEGIAYDFGYLLGLKYVNRFFARKITDASLALRGSPGNSMFVAMRLGRK